MTREELKEHCERQVQHFERVEKIIPVTPNDWKRYEEHKLILELLEQEPCEDAVNRQAVLNTLDNMDKALNEDRTVENYKELLKECYEVLPSVTPQPNTGHWIEDEVYEELYTCSECGCKLEDEQTYIPRNFCPNCGAEMESD